MVINGYRSKTTDLSDIELLVTQIRKQIEKIADKEYHKLLGDEIAFLCDCITLNILTKQPGECIFEVAEKNLVHQMDLAKRIGAENRFNFSVYVHFLQDDGYTYFKVLTPNPNFLAAFRVLDEYSLTEAECSNEQNPKTKKWQELHSLYHDREPLSVNLTPQINTDPRKVKYPSFEDRKERIARHHLTNYYLNQLAGGAQIPQYLTMRYFDMTMEQILSKSGKQELDRKKMELSQILIRLDQDDSIIFDPNDTSHSDDQEGKTDLSL